MVVLDHCATWRVELLLQTAGTQDNESRVGTFRNNGRWVHDRGRSQGLVKCANPVAPDLGMRWRALLLQNGRLINGVVVQIEGVSYRLRQNADLVPDQIRSKALIHPPPASVITPQKRRGRPRKVAEVTTSTAAHWRFPTALAVPEARHAGQECPINMTRLISGLILKALFPVTVSFD